MMNLHVVCTLHCARNSSCSSYPSSLSIIHTMRKLILLTAVVLALVTERAFAQTPTAILGPGLGAGRTAYVQNFHRTLSKDTVYTLTGIYIIDSTYSLTIPAGTLMLADTVATLFVARG